MNKDRIREFLPLVKSKLVPQQNRAGWVLSSCPFAPWKHDGGVDRHPSFAVKIAEGGVSRYNCFSCNSHGDMNDMVLELRELLGKDRDGYDFQTAMQLIATEEDEFDFAIKDYKEQSPDDQDEVTIFPEWWLDSFEDAWEFKKSKNYLKSRGISKKICRDLDLRFDTYRNRVCFPIRDWDGFLVGLHGRAIDDNKLRYFAYGYQEKRNRLPWVGENWVDLDKPVILVEGPFDLASIYRVYKNVLCSNSASMSKAKAKRLSDAGEIITMYDYGKGGDAARAAIDKYLKCEITHLVPDQNQGDPGDMTVPEIVEVIEEYVY